MRRLSQHWNRFCLSVYAGITVVLIWCVAILWTLAEVTRLP